MQHSQLELNIVQVDENSSDSDDGLCFMHSKTFGEHHTVPEESSGGHGVLGMLRAGRKSIQPAGLDGS